MSPLLRSLLWYAAMVGSTANTQLPEITDQDFISQCVDAHNDYRAGVTPTASNMLYLTWDAALARTARAWARNCTFIHNPRLDTPRELHPTFNSVGENIWIGAPTSSFTVKKAMKLWYDEVAAYDYGSNRCSRVCGHYTQVVWATSYKVGCAVQACPNGVKSSKFANKPGAIFVCNYGDAGNYVGVRPYKMGQSCSACGEGSCWNNLCRSDWPSSCGPYCLAVLIIRPLSVLFIFAGVYGLQILYPNIFAYE